MDFSDVISFWAIRESKLTMLHFHVQVSFQIIKLMKHHSLCTQRGSPSYSETFQFVFGNFYSEKCFKLFSKNLVKFFGKLLPLCSEMFAFVFINLYSEMFKLVFGDFHRCIRRVSFCFRQPMRSDSATCIRNFECCCIRRLETVCLQVELHSAARMQIPCDLRFDLATPNICVVFFLKLQRWYTDGVGRNVWRKMLMMSECHFLWRRKMKTRNFGRLPECHMDYAFVVHCSTAVQSSTVV